jgi:hypothetical protein
MQSLASYIEQLERHDWHYDYSDDLKVYISGAASFHHLKQEKNSSELHKRAFEIWHAYVYLGLKREERDRQIAELKAEALITS